jgi:hypothetical protein
MDVKQDSTDIKIKALILEVESYNPEDQPIYKYDDEGRLIRIHYGTKKYKFLKFERVRCEPRTYE